MSEQTAYIVIVSGLSDDGACHVEHTARIMSEGNLPHLMAGVVTWHREPMTAGGVDLLHRVIKRTKERDDALAQVAALTEERDRLLACVAEWQASCAERTKERDQARDDLEATIRARDERSRLIEELEIDLSKESEEHAKVRKNRRWHRKAKSAAVGALMEEREQHKRVVADLKAQIDAERATAQGRDNALREELRHAKDQLRMARAGKEPKPAGPCVQELRAEVLALQETLRHTTRALAALASDRRER